MKVLIVLLSSTLIMALPLASHANEQNPQARNVVDFLNKYFQIRKELKTDVEQVEGTGFTLERCASIKVNPEEVMALVTPSMKCGNELKLFLNYAVKKSILLRTHDTGPALGWIYLSLASGSFTNAIHISYKTNEVLGVTINGKPCIN